MGPQAPKGRRKVEVTSLGAHRGGGLRVPEKGPSGSEGQEKGRSYESRALGRKGARSWKLTKYLSRT